MTLVDHRLAEVMELPDGRTVEWEAIGAGPPLIWVEGGPGFWAHMARPDVALVSDLFRCYLVNAPGCGRTSTPPTTAGYDLPAVVAFFEDVRRALGLGRVTVMGHSWGGLLAAAWAAAHPESVERLVVVDGYPGGNQSGAWDAALTDAARDRALARHQHAPWFEAAMQALTDEDESDAAGDEADEIATIAAFEPAWPLYFADPTSHLAAPHIARLRSEVRWNLVMNRTWFDEEGEYFNDIDILPSLAAVDCPTLVVVGEHDFICGPVWNRPIALAIAGARYEVIADAGHVPQYEQPAAFRAVLLDWLATT